MNVERFELLLHHLNKLANPPKPSTWAAQGEPAAKPAYAPVLAWGESGVGKSETIKRVARQVTDRTPDDPRGPMQVIDLRLGTQEVGDLIGLPRDGVGPDGEPCTIHAKPDWFPAPNTRGFLFFDELNRGPLETQQAVFQCILDRTMHTHKLPDGWIIVSAVNPATEDYEVREMYDKAFFARFLHVAFEPTVAEWLTYATENAADWSIRALIGNDAKFLGKLTVNLPKLAPTPRTWMMLARLLPSLPAQLEQEVAIGLVGTEAGVAWLKVRTSPERPVKGAEVMRSYPAVRPRIAAFVKAHRNDMLKVTLDEIAAITEKEGYTITDDELDNMVRCTLDCPQDLAYAYLKLRFIRNPALRRRLSQRDDLYEHVARINKEAGIS